jgi:hypothetical protein
MHPIHLLLEIATYIANKDNARERVTILESNRLLVSKSTISVPPVFCFIDAFAVIPSKFVHLDKR